MHYTSRAENALISYVKTEKSIVLNYVKIIQKFVLIIGKHDTYECCTNEV
jgi:hypothetical protein